MKNYSFGFHLLFSIIFYSLSFSQNSDSQIITKYQTESEILYYEIDSFEIDEYMNEKCRLEFYYPQNQSDYSTVVWFHGGGLKAGINTIPEELKNHKIAIASVRYRLYPKISSPTYIEDAAAAVAWVFKNIQKYGGDPNKIFVSGHSAGGYLASMIGLDKKWLAKHNVDANDIAGLIPFSGHTITHFTVREERGIPGEQPIIDELAPLFHVRSDAPPLVLITGDRELEMLGRYEENAYLMRMMKVVGHEKTTLYELQGFDHVGMVKPAFFILLNYLSDFISK
jgi:acetyl esterase/lipase